MATVWHTKEEAAPPQSATVHFLHSGEIDFPRYYSRGMIFAHAACGTYGRDLWHSDDPKQVTCERCHHSIHRRDLPRKVVEEAEVQC